jgi:DNA polymerase
MINLLDDQGCARCPALAISRSRIVHGYGDTSARIVFVGEAPGRLGADRTGVPFSGDKSGRALQSILIALGLMENRAPTDRPRLRCFVTNVARCCPPANRTPTPREQANCRPFLEQELDRIDPRVIVPVGRLALQAIGVRYLGYAPAGIRALHAIPIQANGRIILPLIHPARIARAQVNTFVEVMRRVLGSLSE